MQPLLDLLVKQSHTSLTTLTLQGADILGIPTADICRDGTVAWNFHMSCVTDGHLWLVVAATTSTVQGVPEKNNPLGKIRYLWNCCRFFRQIYGIYRGRLESHILRIFTACQHSLLCRALY